VLHLLQYLSDFELLNFISAPLDELAPHILRYWKTRLNDKEIVQALQKHFNTEHCGIGCVYDLIAYVPN
jgi:hypothetical protein